MKSEVEDWLTELPPLDGGDEEPEADIGAGEDLLPGLDGDASLDDAASEDLAVDDGLDITADEPSREDDDERWEADVGEPDLDIADEEGTSEGDTPGLSESELDLDDDLPVSDDDAGEEGTTDPVEHSLDEELPALDADDEGDFEDALLLEAGIEPTPADVLSWADAAWERRSSPQQAPVWDLADGDAVAGMIARAAPEVWVASTLRGRVLVSTVGEGAEARARDISSQLPAMTRAGEPAFVALSSAARPRLWVANRAGQLAESRDLGQSWTACAGVGRPILALATHENGSLSVLAEREGATELLTSTDGARWFARRVAAEVRVVPPSSPRAVWLAVHGSAVAIGDALGVWVSRDGRQFVRVPASAGAIAGAFAGETTDAPLILAMIPGPREERARLVRVLSDGTAEIVADLTPDSPDDEREDSPSVLALCWDASAHALVVALPALRAMWGPSRKELA